MTETNTCQTAPLAAIDLIDTRPDALFDRVAQLAINHLRTDVALVTFFDPRADWVHFKSQVGLAEPWASQSGMTLSDSICQFQLQHNGPLVIPDTRTHHLVKGSSVAEKMGIVTYLGAPIHDESQATIGSVFVVGAKPRAWDVLEVACIEDLARCISDYIAVKIAALRLQGQAERSEAEARARANMLADISHEIRTPLNGLLGMADALAQTDLAEPQRQMLALMQQAGDQLRRLADDLMDLVQIEAGASEMTQEAFTPSETVRTVIDLIRAGNPAGTTPVGIEDEAGGETVVIGSEPQIRQVLGNLLNHALAFNPEGSVRVRSSLETGNGGNTTLKLAVIDSGPDIPDDQKLAVFERLHQAAAPPDRPQQGAGLGLAIARALCRQHGGDLRIEDTPGGGATFAATFAVRAQQG